MTPSSTAAARRSPDSASPAFHRDSASITASGSLAFVVPPGSNAGAAPAFQRRGLNRLSMSMSPAPPVKPVCAVYISRTCSSGSASEQIVEHSRSHRLTPDTSSYYTSSPVYSSRLVYVHIIPSISKYDIAAVPRTRTRGVIPIRGLVNTAAVVHGDRGRITAFSCHWHDIYIIATQEMLWQSRDRCAMCEYIHTIHTWISWISNEDSSIGMKQQ